MQKDKPLFYLETHAGKGLYHLKDKQAEKTKEYQQGIKPIWENRKSLPTVFQDYIQSINQLNDSHDLVLYPGSPYLAINALRKQDRSYFCELHPTEFEILVQMPRFNKKAYMSNTDGILALNALLPPPEKRGLIFIDPSFEIKEEYKQIPLAIKHAFTRFATGVYCLWYPVVDRKLIDRLIRGMKDIHAKNALRVEFNLTLAPKEGMTGCGLWIINPPYTFATEIKKALDTLRTYFNPGVSSYIVENYSGLEK
jgi:23S rRNA (adenine2030-N6)-methyltransferase